LCEEGEVGVFGVRDCHFCSSSSSYYYTFERVFVCVLWLLRDVWLSVPSSVSSRGKFSCIKSEFFCCCDF